MIIKRINDKWYQIGEWCDNKKHVIYQIPRKVKLDERGQPIQIGKWEYMPADDNDEMIEVCRQGERCNICANCVDCFQTDIPTNFNGELNDYEITVNRATQRATIGNKNAQGLIKEYERELDEIEEWFAENDYKPNKIICGEWQSSDVRWTDYLAERTVKRARRDELNTIIANL